MRQGIAMATGMQSRPDWKAFLAAGVNAGIGYGVGTQVSDPAISSGISSGLSVIANDVIYDQPIDLGDAAANGMGAMVGEYGGKYAANKLKPAPKPTQVNMRKAANDAAIKVKQVNGRLGVDKE